MPSPEYAPFSPDDLTRLTAESQDEFYGGGIEIDGITHYLSRRIPAGTQAPNLSARQATAEVIAQSLNTVALRSSSSQERPFVSLPVDSIDSTIVGIARRVELEGLLESFGGGFFPSDENYLKDCLRETIKLSNEERSKGKMIEEGTQLIASAIRRKSNLLCLFTLGEFFACLVSRSEERGISSQGGLLVPMPKEKIVQALRCPTEPESLYFLLRVKQLGKERTRTLAPLVWIAIINSQPLLTPRGPRMTGPFEPAMHPRPIIDVHKTGTRSGDTPLGTDTRVPTRPKPGGGKPHPPGPQRRIW